MRKMLKSFMVWMICISFLFSGPGSSLTVFAENVNAEEAVVEEDSSQDGNGKDRDEWKNGPVCDCESTEGGHAETCPLYEAPGNLDGEDADTPENMEDADVSKDAGVSEDTDIAEDKGVSEDADTSEDKGVSEDADVSKDAGASENTDIAEDKGVSEDAGASEDTDSTEDADSTEEEGVSEDTEDAENADISDDIDDSETSLEPGEGGTECDCGSTDGIHAATCPYNTEFIDEDLYEEEIITSHMPSVNDRIISPLYDDTYVKSVDVKIGADGSEPLDSDDAPGHDSDLQNGIVRSFDTLVYDVTVAVESYHAQYYDSDIIHFEATLPVSEKEAVFDTASMNYLDSCNVAVNGDGEQVLTGTYQMKKKDDLSYVVPGTADLKLYIKVRAMENGSQLQPTVKFWMENNEEDPDTGTLRGLVTKDFPAVQVSAGLKLNVQLKEASESSTSVEGTFDFSGGNENALNKVIGRRYGRLFCYGVTLQLCNADADRGLRGLELPEGDITLKLNYSASYQTESGMAYAADSAEMAEFQPLIYSVAENSDATGQADGRELKTAEGYTPGTLYAANVAPFNERDSYNGCEDGGEWKGILNADGSLTLRISDYKIDTLRFPYGNSHLGAENYIYYSKDALLENIDAACFSAGEIWVLLPFENAAGERIEDKLGQGTFSLTVEDYELSANSVTGQQCGDQQKTDDDREVLTCDLKKTGIFNNRVFYSNSAGTPNFMNADILGGSSYVNNGKDYALIGQKGTIGIAGGFDYSAEGSAANSLAAYNALLKFDGAALKLTGEVILPEKYGHSTPSAVYWGYLPDGRNWNDDEEMQAAGEQDLLWDSVFSADRRYVAVLVENRTPSSAVSMQYTRFFCGVEVREDFSLANGVSMLCEATRLWTVSRLSSLHITAGDIPGVMDADFSEAVYPAASYSKALHYTKAVYDASGYAGGHNGDRDAGDSLYLMSCIGKVELNPAQTTVSDSGVTSLKTNYNLDRGERTADFVITPRLVMAAEPDSSQNTTTTVYITASIPEGMSYVTGSAYRGGTYQQGLEGEQGTVVGGTEILPGYSQKNPDGSVTVTWIMMDVPVENRELDKIYFSCKLGDEGNLTNDLTDNSSRTVEVRISTDEDKREAASFNGNLSSQNITVTRLGASAFGTAVEQELNEVNENIAFTVNYFNNGDSAMNLFVVDAMPYDGDLSGSMFDGSYSVAAWQLDITAAKGDGNPDRPDSFTLYYTTDPQYKDVILGDTTGNGTVSRETVINTWQTAAIGADGKAVLPGTPVAWALAGSLGGGNISKIRMELKQTDPSGTDVLANKASEGHFYRIVKARRVQRNISGKAWMDENRDGRLDSKENGYAGLGVTLQMLGADGVTWSTARDLQGSECRTVTGSDGAYSFHNLGAGTYRVLFADGDTGTVKLKVCSVTQQNAQGVPESLSSKAEAMWNENTQELTGAVIENVVLPEAETIMDSTYTAANLHAGFYRNPVEVSLTGKKSLTGVAGAVAPVLEADDYTFVLKDETGKTLQEKTNGADGVIAFDALEFYVAGEYSCTIEEVIPDRKDPCIIYDEKPVSVTVKVETGADGRLISQVIYKKDGKNVGEAEFVNQYQRPQTISFSLSAEKVLEGRKLAADQFSFVLKPKNGAPMPAGSDGSMLASVTVKNNGNGEIIFPEISVSEEKDMLLTPGGTDKYEYQYEITEVKGDDTSYAYDGQTITATVTINKTADYKLKAEINYKSSRQTQTTGIAGWVKGLSGAGESQNVFRNTYVAPASAQLVLTGTKQLNGRNVKSGEFTFALTPQKGAPGKAQTVTCKDDGTFEFDALIFAEDEFPDSNTTKTYSYVITEEQGKNPSYTYDEKEVTVRVTVRKVIADGESRLVVEQVTYSEGAESVSGIVFENTYTKPASTKVKLEGKKVLKGKELAAGQFTFILTPVGNAPGAEQKVTNQLNGNFSFGEIVFEEDEKKLDFGDGSESLSFQYRIREQNDGKKNYTYDLSDAIVTVRVKKNGKNELEVMDITCQKNGKAVKEILFTNIYQEPATADEPDNKTTDSVDDTAANPSDSSDSGNTSLTGPSLTAVSSAANQNQVEAIANTGSGAATGDDTPIAVWIILLFTAMLAAGGVIVVKRKGGRKKPKKGRK